MKTKSALFGNPASYRWLLLLVFAFGLLDNGSALIGEDRNFLWLSFISILALSLLLTQLNRPSNEVLWIWIILSVFLIGYYIQTYLTAHFIDSPHIIASRFTPEWLWVNTSTLSKGYYWITLAFVVCCLSSWIVLMMSRKEYFQKNLSTEEGSFSLKWVLIVMFCAALLSMATAAVRTFSNIGIMGIVTQRLPFHLDSIIFRFQSNIIPVVLLLCFWITDKLESRWRFGALFILFIHWLTVGLITSSRSGLVHFTLSLFFLWMITKRFTRFRKSLVVFMLVGTILLFPVISKLRYIRMNTSESLPRSLVLTMDQFSADEIIDSLDFITTQIVIRVTGASGVWYALKDIQSNYSLDRTVRWLFKESIVIYYTRSIVGIENPGDFRAPGLVGAFMLLGGVIGVILLWFFTIIFVRLLWDALSKLKTAPVALAACAHYVLFFVMEGTLRIQDFFAFLISLVLLETIYRIVIFERHHEILQTGAQEFKS